MKVKRLYDSNIFLKSVFVVSLFVMIFILACAYRHVTNLSSSTDLVVHTLKVNLEFKNLVSHIKDLETEHRGYLITGNRIFYNDFDKAKAKVLKSFVQLQKLSSDNQMQQARILSLKNMVLNRTRTLEKTFSSTFMPDVNNNYNNYWYSNDKISINIIEIKVRQMIRVEENLLKERQSKYNSNSHFTPIFLFIIFLLTMIFIVLAYFKTSADFKKIEQSNQRLLIFEESTKQAEILGKFGSWTWNLSNNKLIYSDNLYRIVGEEPQSFEASNENFLEYVHPEDKLIVENIVESIIKDEDLPYVFYRIVTKNGQTKHLKSFGKLIIDTFGDKTILGITIDATDEYFNIREMFDRNKKLEQNNQELSAFNYIASHDLQEPLRKIQTFISRIQDSEADNVTNNGKIYLDKIENSATRMRSLIDDLLQFSKMNKTEKIYEKVDLNEVLKTTQQDLAPLFEEENVELLSNHLPQILGVEFQIKQLFLNLITNAIKYKKLDLAPRIKIDCEIVFAESEEKLKQNTSDKYYKITFWDNGMGFEESYNDKIFILFNRLHSKTDYPGTGIGLSICRKVVENHNGYIFASGQPNVGATFEVYFPIA
jgi:signal transduction histidine kinase/CHASE3 domain sensor protein